MAIATTANLLLGIAHTDPGHSYMEFMVNHVGMDRDLCKGGTWYILTPMMPFAVELCLKAIKSQRKQEFLKEHDLKKLWEDLCQDDQDGIRNIIEDQAWKQEENRLRFEFGLTGEIRALEDVLDDHRNDFMKWRYVVEGEHNLPPQLASIGIYESVMDLFGTVFACVEYHKKRDLE